MSTNPSDSDLLAAQLATGGAAIAFVLAAVGGWFVNYGIAIGFFAGAALLFIAANKFHALARLKLQWPASLSEDIERPYWEVFKLAAYLSSAVAIVLSLVFGGFFYIFDLRAQIAETAKISRYTWPMLSSDEAVALRAKLRPIPPTTVAIVCSEQQCADFARSFEDVFVDLDWKVTCCSWPYDGFDPGIYLWGQTPQFQALAAEIESATHGRLKVNVSSVPHLDKEQFNLQISIGPKPRT